MFNSYISMFIRLGVKKPCYSQDIGNQIGNICKSHSIIWRDIGGKIFIPVFNSSAGPWVFLQEWFPFENLWQCLTLNQLWVSDFARLVFFQFSIFILHSFLNVFWCYDIDIFVHILLHTWNYPIFMDYWISVWILTVFFKIQIFPLPSAVTALRATCITPSFSLPINDIWSGFIFV